MRANQNQRHLLIALAAACVLLADVGSAFAQITIPTVPVGNADNAPDGISGIGEVDYNYSIGEYDVTSSQYTAFLNAVAHRYLWRLQLRNGGNGDWLSRNHLDWFLGQLHL
jgi:hypothetical protein